MKTRKDLLSLFFIILWGTTCAQPHSLNKEMLIQHQWTDGYEFVKYVSPDVPEIMGLPNPASGHPERLFFVGGSLHEGGTHFCLEEQDSLYTVTDLGKQMYPWFPAGSLLYPLDQHLILRDRNNGTLLGVLQPFSLKEDLETIIQQDLLAFGLSGSYRDENGHRYAFSSTKCCAEGFSSPHFSFGYVFETPTLVLVFENETYLVEKKGKQLLLHPARKEEYYYQPLPNTPPLVLHRISRPSEYDFPLTGKKVLTQAEIRLYSGACSNHFHRAEVLENLATMRNEIFARHGYKFNSEHWKSHFEKKTWYHAVSTSIDGQLSEVEKINVEHLLKIEKDLQNEAGF